MKVWSSLVSAVGCWSSAKPAVLCTLGLSIIFNFATSPVSAAKLKLNDTGQDVCVNPINNSTIECVGSGQDGEFGRDFSRPSLKDGRVGFSFVKIADDGTLLPRKAKVWSCVKDEVTGLTWEIKTDDGGLRDKDNRYTNYGDGRLGDASALPSTVNLTGLCGFQDWRLPDRTELQSLVDYSKHYPGPTIDTVWFINSNGGVYWSGSNYAANPSAIWSVNFNDGYVGGQLRGSLAFVRLVRSAQ